MKITAAQSGSVTLNWLSEGRTWSYTSESRTFEINKLRPLTATTWAVDSNDKGPKFINYT